MNDLDFMKDKFDNDGIRAPESLSEDKMLEMLKAHDDAMDAAGSHRAEILSDSNVVLIPQGNVNGNAKGNGKNSTNDSRRTNRRTTVRRWVAIAACLLLVVIAGPRAYYSIGVPSTALQNGELYTFKSSGEIDKLVRSIERESYGGFWEKDLGIFQPGGGSNDIVYETDTVEDAATEEAPAMGSSGTSNAANQTGTTGSTGAKDATADHSETYLQVEEVDEADIVKTDGKYIYYVNERSEVIILSAKDGKTEKVSTIGYNGVENYVHDIFLKGDLLVTIGVVYDDNDSYSAIVTYDISDRSAPKVVQEFRQSGSILSSRMVGDNVYLVTNEYVRSGNRILPKCMINGAYTEMDPRDICCVPQPDTTSYVILSAVDVTSGKKLECKSKAVFGASNEIYCNDHNLYAVVGEYDRDKHTYFTRVLRAGLNGNKIKFDSTGRVAGYVNDQFSMDERDGYFRIATTSQRDGMDVNNLFILNEKLEEVGKVTGFARNESIKAVRYFGDKAYVITYEQIDPLFIIDVSDPTDPRIEGEVEIEGFSSLLIPISENRLLGIGYATRPNGYGGEYSYGLKLALFDISDSSKPKVLDSKEFENMDSMVQYDHHALMINSKAGYYAFPYGKYIENVIEGSVTDDGNTFGFVEDAETGEEVITDGDDVLIDKPYESKYVSGVLVFEALDKINVLDEHELNDYGEMLYRSVYIGDYIYALDGDGQVYSFKFEK